MSFLRHLSRLLAAAASSYTLVVALALALGLFLPRQAAPLAAASTYFLQAIFFLSSLKMDFREVAHEARDWRLLLLVNGFKMLVLPTVVFLVADRLAPPLAVPLLLLAAMPPGMAAPLMAEVAGGRQGLALVLTVSASLLAPLTVPVVIGAFARTSVNVDAVSMFLTLARVIVVPFLAAQVVRWFWHERIKPIHGAFKPASVILLGLIIAGSVAKQAAVISGRDWGRAAVIVLVLTALGVAMLAVSYRLAWWRGWRDRLTVAICLSFMNFTLAVYLAGAFFKDPEVLLAAVLVIFPWALLLWPFKIVIRQFHPSGA